LPAPRLLIAAAHTSAGKTTVMLGLLGALRARAVRPAPFKAGPDYIDPTLHARAAGRPSRNLDQWLLDEDSLRAVLRRGAKDSDVALIEGVMGLYDGMGSTQVGSTAAVARALGCPVVLVVDVAAMSGTAAAVVLGCQMLRPGVNLVGVILNRVGGDDHAAATAEAVHLATGLPVLGSLPADERLAIPERHLGLVPTPEGGASGAVLDRLADLVSRCVDLDAVLRLARGAPPLVVPDEVPLPPVTERTRIGVAQDDAFGFYYQDAIDVLAECGADSVPFSPMADADLPDRVDGIYLGGGFPELYADALAQNDGMRAAVRAHVGARRPLYAECGGLMAIGRTLTTFEG
jgi:cobyrinic acid a,c-diamide synthase